MTSGTPTPELTIVTDSAIPPDVAATAEELADPEKVYRLRRLRFGAERDRYGRLSDRNGNLNVALAVAALACVGLGIWRAPGFYWLAGVFAMGFVAAYIVLGRVNALQRSYAERWTMCNEGLARRRRDWAALPLPPAADAGAAAPLAGDLDLLGRASLEHLLNTPGTPMGRETLRGWILGAAPPDVIRRRQRAVAELAPLLNFREELAVRGRLVGAAQPAYGAFVRWAEADFWLSLPGMAWLVWLTRALGLLTVALMVAQGVGAVHVPWWLILVTLNGVISAIYWRRLEAEIQPVESLRNACLAYADLFHTVGAQPVRAEDLVRIRAVLAGPGASAETRMRALGRITTLATLRRSILYGAIQLVTLVGFQTAWMLERWRAGSRRGPAMWLAALGELEALCALATLAFDHPDWVFPEVGGEKYHNEDTEERRGRDGLTAEGAEVAERTRSLTTENTEDTERTERGRREGGERAVGGEGEDGTGDDTEGTEGRGEGRNRTAVEIAEEHEVGGGDQEGAGDVGGANGGDRGRAQGDATVVVARGLGHPLLPPAVCVRNDVQVGPPGTLLLVTGSNMSGKSTLLRAIGLNVVLAQAGGPVCAAALWLPPVRLATAIRVRDSLEEGVSYFLAELRRLREIVEAAHPRPDRDQPPLLYLLDEMLHGTNTAERQIAARRILRHLVAQGAIGVVSTHDLTLADTPGLAKVSVPVHFTETLTSGEDEASGGVEASSGEAGIGPVMRFDYRLRPGIATSTNALRLMEAVGLDLTDEIEDA